MKQILIICTMAFWLTISSSFAETFVLSSVKQNVNAENFSMSGNGWSVTKQSLHGGHQEGCEMVTVNNGALIIRVIPTRGMSILDIVKGDVRMGWDSPVPEVVNPAHIDLESRGGLGWLEGFNEWMVRCGLEYAGHPGTDVMINNTGEKSEQTLTLHGKIGNIPASEVTLHVDGNTLRLRGTVYEKFFYGPKFKLVTEIATEIGSDTWSINDSLTNLGGADQEFQLIYHGNYGSSILEGGAMVHATAKSVTPMNAHAAQAVNSWQTYAPPTQGFSEEVYLIEPVADSAGNAYALLHNKAADLATTVSYKIEQLPYFTLWKNTTSREDGYVTGLEPGTGYPFNRMVERSFGRVPKIAPGETRNFNLSYTLLEGAANVSAAVRQIAAVQGGAAIQINTEAPKLPPAP